MSYHLLNTIVLVVTVIYQAHGEGRLYDPPSRSSAWRFGFDTPKNYNDNHSMCGGFEVLWKQNGGKCGICGDPYNGKRDNEVPDGIYAKKLYIVRNYTEGDVFEAQVLLTANHNGFMVFKICEATDDKTEVTQKCLDSHQLKVLNSKATDKYIVPNPEPGTFKIKLQLPGGLTCKRCVFQWTYTEANQYGQCPNGTSAAGCGPQEMFRACADVKIASKANTLDLDNESDKYNEIDY